MDQGPPTRENTLPEKTHLKRGKRKGTKFGKSTTEHEFNLENCFQMFKKFKGLESSHARPEAFERLLWHNQALWEADNYEEMLM